MAQLVKVVNNTKSPTKFRPVNGVAALEDETPVEELIVGSKEERHAYTPHKSYAKKYVNRTIFGILDFDLMKFCMKNNKHLLLRGDTGAGKTMMPMAYASAFGLPYYSIPCDVAIDPTALFGKLMPTDTVGKFEWVDGPVTELVRNGGILNISEVNFMPPKISASLYPLLDHRRSVPLMGKTGEVVEAHKDLLIVADMNPQYRGTTELNVAFANRFHIKVDWGYDANVENSLIKSPTLLGIVRNIRKLDDVRTPVGTNVMEEFLAIAPHLGYNFAVQNFVAQFAPAERDGIKKAFQVAETNLKREISSIKAGSTPDKDMKEVESDPDWFVEEGDPNEFDWEDENG